MGERTAFFITDILSDDDARAWVFGRGSNLEFPFPVAVKTGTSQAYHDNWTVGYTRNVTVGVWVGNFDRTPLHDSSGVTGAGPLFHAIMLAAERRYATAAPHGGPGGEILPTPGDVEQVTICALSGERANRWCPSKLREWVRTGPDAVPCSWHHQSDDGVLTVWPPEFRAWAGNGDSHHLVEKGDSHHFPKHGDRHRFAAAALSIASPPSGALYSIDPTLRPEYQAVPLRATTERATVVTWSVDGRVVGAMSSERALSWPLAVGRHRVTAKDPGGREATADITVR